MTGLVLVLAGVFTVLFFRLTAGLATLVYGDFLPDGLHNIYRRLSWPLARPGWIRRREVAVGIAVAVLVAIEWVCFEALTGDLARLTRLDRALFLVHMLLAAGWIGYLVSLIRQVPYVDGPAES